MPRLCLVCVHPEKAAIDRDLVAGTALPAIAAIHRVSADSLGRHKANHLPGKLTKAQEVREVAQADSLLNQVRALQSRALAILAKAEETGNLRVALSAIREARGNLELLARLLGELQENQTVNILVSPEWLRLRSAVLTILEPYPAAKLALAGALEGADADAQD